MIYLEYRSRYEIHERFRFNGLFIKLYGPGMIKLGKGSYIGDYSTLQADETCKIEVGQQCQISHNVRIYTSSTLADQDFSQPKTDYNGNVVIGDYVWIGANVFINPGIEIGENSILGANSVITRNIPPHCIAVGVPAKVLKFKSYLTNSEKLLLEEDYLMSLSSSYKR